jgi:Fibronectin type III domain/Repeat of unknown function (DUF5648)
MKRTTWIMAGFSLLLFAAMVAAQTNTMDQASEKAVKITQGPNITNITGNSATIHWTTDKVAANHVKYRVAGSGNWQSAYHPGGSKDHSLQLTNLQPGQTYEWQVLTRDGDVRTSGQFQTAATAAGTAPDVNAASAGAAAGAGGAPSTPGAAPATGPKVPLYRFVSTNSAEHLYSTSATPQGNFRLEGPAGYILSQPADGTAPLYVLRSAGDVVLTTSGSEALSGFQNQGVIGYIATSQQPGTQPLYRMVTAKGDLHFFTASPQEHAQVLQQGIFHDEGTVGYIWTQQ